MGSIADVIFPYYLINCLSVSGSICWL